MPSLSRYRLGLRIDWLFLCVLLAAPCVAAETTASSGTSPRPEKNILLVVADDEGTTLGCYGDPIAVTPNIDALAADGVRFTNAFATTASCSASRSVLLSGLHNHRNGQYGHAHHFHKFASYHDVVSLALPRVLANAGYRTARAGKYHVAPEAVYHFENTLRSKAKGPASSPRNTVALAEACRDFLTDRSDTRPFFLYYATIDPHRGSKNDRNSERRLKPNLFGNRPNKQSYEGVEEVFYDPQDVPVPAFLPDSPEAREELAQYYQATSRVDQGLGRLIDILKETGQYDKTLIVFTSDHGVAFAGAKTTVYEPGLKVPLVVRDPYQSNRGTVSDRLVSHVDMTPTLVDFAGALDTVTNGPAKWQDPAEFWERRGEARHDNRNGGYSFRSYQGRSWKNLLNDPLAEHRRHIVASHTFHEITMYYPMRVYRDTRYKLIWNIAHGLDYPFATDLWAASSWQAQLLQGPQTRYGNRSIEAYIRRPEFELYDIASDPNEAYNLAEDPAHAETLRRYQGLLKKSQKELGDPWVSKWNYE